MLDLEDYSAVLDHTAAWGIYGVAAVIFLFAYLQLTRRWQFDVRWLLFVLLAVLLLVPAPVPGRNVLAPAMIMLALSPFTGTAELIADVLARLLLAGTIAVVLVIVIGVVRRARLRRR